MTVMPPKYLTVRVLAFIICCTGKLHAFFPPAALSENNPSCAAKQPAKLERLFAFDSDRTWRNPEIRMSTPEIIRRRGYKVEEHEVTTEDGYTLVLFRIPGKGPPVLFLHGALCDSSIFIIGGTESSLAYQLADQGYDIYLANHRGTKYSKTHTTFSWDSPEYWDFSYHDIGQYEVPAFVDKIIEISGKKKMFYVGWSQGGTEILVALSINQHLNENFQGLFLFAPAVTLDVVPTTMKRMCRLVHANQQSTHTSRFRFITPDEADRVKFMKSLCTNPFLQPLCEYMILLLFGSNADNIDMAVLGTLIQHYFQPNSVKDLRHLCQNALTNRFSKFDYGEDKNFQRYGTSDATDYNLRNIKTKVFIYAGECDFIVTRKNCETLHSNLRNSVLEVIPGFGHASFFFDKDSSKLISQGVMGNMSALSIR